MRLDDILENTYQNILRKAYSNTVSGSQENSLEFNAAIANGTTINTAFGGDGFSNKLQMVAKTIAARDLLGLRRQTFFVQKGGKAEGLQNDHQDDSLETLTALTHHF